jgi:hypothetical protein
MAFRYAIQVLLTKSRIAVRLPARYSISTEVRALIADMTTALTTPKPNLTVMDLRESVVKGKDYSGKQRVSRRLFF